MAGNRDRIITLRLRNGRTIRGRLQEFDIHMNLTLHDAQDVTDEKPVEIGSMLLRGDNVLLISLPDEEP